MAEAARGVPEGLSAPSSAASWSPFPESVAETLSHLANLIDRSIAVRGVGSSVRDFAAAFLGVPPIGLIATTARLRTMAFQLAGLAFADDLQANPPAALIGDDQETPPRWEALSLGEIQVSIPFCLAAAFHRQTVADCPLVVWFDDEYEDGQFTITVYARADDAEAAANYLNGLLERSRARTNPFKGRVLQATHHDDFGLVLSVVELPVTSREDVVLPAAVWRDVDRNVHGFFRALDRLKGAGLSRNRGLLLEGPPGTGKTALCRVVAGELTGTTVIFCDAATVGHDVRGLFRELDHLAPALVVMEDIDLVIGSRHGSANARALNDFLLALDGALSAHEGVVTIATTNDLRGIDPAARRSARFDVVISVPEPDAAARAAILQRYLRTLGADVDVLRVAAHTAGASGADLRELVSQAVVQTAEDDSQGRPGRVTTDLLLRLARQRRPPAPAGLYL